MLGDSPPLPPRLRRSEARLVAGRLERTAHRDTPATGVDHIPRIGLRGFAASRHVDCVSPKATSPCREEGSRSQPADRYRERASGRWRRCPPAASFACSGRQRLKLARATLRRLETSTPLQGLVGRRAARRVPTGLCRAPTRASWSLDSDVRTSSDGSSRSERNRGRTRCASGRAGGSFSCVPGRMRPRRPSSQRVKNAPTVSCIGTGASPRWAWLHTGRRAALPCNISPRPPEERLGGGALPPYPLVVDARHPAPAVPFRFAAVTAST